MNLKSKLDKKTLINIYENLIKPRMIEEKMLIYLRQGKISKWFSGWGQEAISVVSTMLMEEDEYILPMHRNPGVFTTRNVDLQQLFAQFLGKKEGFSKGRERSFHFGTMEHHIIGMISHLGPQMAIACGIALANKLKNNNKITVVYTGDGATSEGDFHEALNVASVWKLPIIFIIENNQWGLSTNTEEQYACKNLIDKAIGYGMESKKINGNDVLEVYDSINNIRDYVISNSKPFLLECITFRIRGHEEASGVKYYPDGLIEEWEKKDPIKNFEDYLKLNNVIDDSYIENVKLLYKEKVEVEFHKALKLNKIIPDSEEELNDVFKENISEITNSNSSSIVNMRFIDSIHNALDLAMQKWENLILMGQDIAEYGGVFKATDGFASKYGKNRVRNTPICESAIVGTAQGLSLNGFKAMVEMQFSDFVSVGFNQIVNNMAKLHWRWGQNVDAVIRMPSGANVNAGPFHSQSLEAWFTHVPGLKVVYPSNPYDAKGLLLRAFEDPNPVIFFEHKYLYRSINQDIPSDYYTIEFGKANIIIEGKDLTIITYGLGVIWAKEYVENSKLSIEVIDLRTLVPLDKDTIFESVRKTNRVVVLAEANGNTSFASELVSLISENCFEYLDAPVMKITSLETPIPFSKVLEDNYLANSRMGEIIDKIMKY